MGQKKSISQFIKEDVLRMRIKGKKSASNDIRVAGDGGSLIDFLDDSGGANIVNTGELNAFRTLSRDRETQYKLFDQMCEDSIIASAIEMYADDATQYNNKGQVIWAESDNNDVANFANRLIDILGLNKDAWSHIYSLCKYGDLYIETFRDDEVDEDESVSDNMRSDLRFADAKVDKRTKGAKFEEYIEAYSNPSVIFDITRHGKTVGFVESEIQEDNTDPFSNAYRYIKQGERITIKSPDKYVHIMLSNNVSRYPEKLCIEYVDEDNEARVREYRVNRGKSILHDIYKIYREVNLMEDSLLLNRVTRSSIIRLLQIEVGDMPKSQARELLKRVKNLVEQKNFMDKESGTFSNMASPGPVDNIIYIPTHDGKGSISASNLGGDVDVKSIVDIDYYKNKLYAGLKIPKQFLGEDVDGGLGGGTSLTKLDARYARTIKRIQNSYIEGITTLINLFAIDKGLTSHVNNFTIKMVSPSTTEDQERDESLDNRVNIVSNLMSLLDNDSIASPEARRKILMYFINNYFNEPEVTDIMNGDQMQSEEDVPVDEESDDEGFGGFGGGTTNFDSGMDMSMDTTPDEFGDGFSDEGSTDSSDNETPEPPEPADNTDFGDFSDEFSS